MATKKKGKKNAAKPVDISKFAEDIGARMVRQFRDELNMIKNPANAKQSLWGILSEIQQGEILDRYKQRVTHELTHGYTDILAAGFPAVHATLAKVAFGSKAIQGSLDIPFGSSHRHELADFSGKQVLVVMADDLEAYLASMDKVKPDSDQNELPLGDHGESETLKSDPRTMAELQEAAGTLAEEIGEPDVPGLVGKWTREHLLDYIGYAEGKKAELENGKSGKAKSGKGAQPTLN